MKKIPHLDINCIPSQLNTSAPTGVASQLASSAEQKPHFDGMTIDQMRGNPLFERCDDIDKVGLAQKKLVDSAKIIKSKSRTIRALNDAAQRLAKPSSKH